MMTFEKFKKYIDHIETESILFDKMSEVSRWYNENTVGELELRHISELETDLVEILESLFEDECQWISYYCYETDFGKRFVDGDIIDVDGSFIKLHTVEDLYKLLEKNKT